LIGREPSTDRQRQIGVTRPALLVALLTAAVAACGSGDADQPVDTVPAVTTSEPPPADETPSTSPPSTSAAPATGDAAVAIADLAERRGVDPADIVTVAVENVTWRSSAIGCPQKDMMYQQVLTDGVRIILELDGRRYQYHAGGGRGPFYCATPERPAGE